MTDRLTDSASCLVSAEGDISGLSYKETAIDVDLVVGGQSGKLDFNLFAGGSSVKVEADLVGALQKTEAYPYDEVSVTLPTASVSDSPFGFNVGAGLDYRFSDRVAFGAQFVYRSAKAKLETTDGATIEVDAGDVEAGFGERQRRRAAEAARGAQDQSPQRGLGGRGHDLPPVEPCARPRRTHTGGVSPNAGEYSGRRERLARRPGGRGASKAGVGRRGRRLKPRPRGRRGATKPRLRGVLLSNQIR